MKDPRVYLAHILECIGYIEAFTEPGRDTFFAERVIQDAVIRNLEVIGEAAKRVGAAYRTAHPGIPWRSMAGLRDVLIHDYEGVDINQVWQVVERDLPGLKASIAAVLPSLEQLEAELAGESEPNNG